MASRESLAFEGDGVLKGNAEGIRRYQEVGVQDFRFDFPTPSPDAMFEAMQRFAAEVRPQML